MLLRYRGDFLVRVQIPPGDNVLQTNEIAVLNQLGFRGYLLAVELFHEPHIVVVFVGVRSDLKSISSVSSPPLSR